MTPPKKKMVLPLKNVKGKESPRKTFYGCENVHTEKETRHLRCHQKNGCTILKAWWYHHDEKHICKNILIFPRGFKWEKRNLQNHFILKGSHQRDPCWPLHCTLTVAVQCLCLWSLSSTGRAKETQSYTKTKEIIEEVANVIKCILSVIRVHFFAIKVCLLAKLHCENIQ